MRLATLADNTPDGRLVLVSPDGERLLSAAAVAPNLQAALDQWENTQSRLEAIAARFATGDGEPLAGRRLLAPLPRAWQWLDGSAFQSHGDLMNKVLGTEVDSGGRPLMYQGLSDRFLGPNDDVPIPDEALGIDFEGEFGVIVDAVPMGTDAAAALENIKLVVQINDWSLRMLAGTEMKTGFGWVQAKPACSMAPFAVTPDELGDDWRDGRVCSDLVVEWNGTRFGSPNGEAMGFGFHELVAHAARTRALPAGTIIGSGTVSNQNFREIGSACIAERRGIEVIDEGAPRTEFMRFGDRVRMEGQTSNGATPFGAIDQKVVSA